ncbi:hypothetical protein TTHERM_000569259 (macronuclear) [Tetrahymena thermophila SB210]|uniref:Uncharacterized protein n=1 Tax=Tetrahymena thermophila (strain SB210) TaxID=312017 RepID=W7X4G6_TETTS|nr:hypothetical protein TTHERM_000569259 [Tetrahymena thermophila SB210]EWS72292.1 hypothetical protein TTHERM_000569259 [Tetrahymena thermophila SB210]|eukprot:XP_012655232.1 hypothetical protein TTHERM_000569259 [Tetrahymena thermophila SB210]
MRKYYQKIQLFQLNLKKKKMFQAIKIILCNFLIKKVVIYRLMKQKQYSLNITNKYSYQLIWIQKNKTKSKQKNNIFKLIFIQISRKTNIMRKAQQRIIYLQNEINQNQYFKMI